MLKVNQKVKSGLINTLMDKANRELDKLSNKAERAPIIGATVSAILPILREHVKMLGKFTEENKSCGKDSNE